jgi:DNA-binding SARP family transcriptional activator
MSVTGLSVALLRPMEVRRECALVAVGGDKARIVLATMALSAGRPVGTAALADRVWGERLPRSVEASLANHVARLRRTLSDGAIRTVPDGYLLDVDQDRIDVLRFRRLAGEAARHPDPDRARAAG